MIEQALPVGVFAVRLVLGEWRPPDSAGAVSIAVIEQAFAKLREAKLRAEFDLFEITVPVGQSGLRAVGMAQAFEFDYRRKVQNLTDRLRAAVDHLVARWPDVCREVQIASADSQRWLPTAQTLKEALAVTITYDELTEANVTA